MLSVRQKKVNRVFDAAADCYDLMNDLMSVGIHRIWKNIFVSKLAAHIINARTIIDVAGGTGDIAFRIAEKLRNNTSIFVCDINQAMLEIAERRYKVGKIELLGAKNVNLNFVVGNAENLPFADDCFDAYTIAFGIRNVPCIEKALVQAHRVLQPGGLFLCLEFSEVRPRFLKRLYDMYSFAVIPRLGRLVTGEMGPYRYLVDSIRNFPDQEHFAGMIRNAGFSDVVFSNLTCGVVAIHSGWKL